MLAFLVNSNAPDAGKGVLYPERTRNATDAVVGKSLMKSDMSAEVWIAYPADWIRLLALRVPNGEFVYTNTYHRLW